MNIPVSQMIISPISENFLFKFKLIFREQSKPTNILLSKVICQASLIETEILEMLSNFFFLHQLPHLWLEENV